MITRDSDNNIVISPDDIPALAALVEAGVSHITADLDKCPASLRPAVDAILSAGEVFNKALTRGNR